MLFRSMTDNYNTEQTERLHIDTTKDAYDATNHKDEFHQMTIWTERREKVQLHTSFIKWRQRTNGESTPSMPVPIGPPRPSARRLKMAQNPMLKAVSFNNLARNYGVTIFLSPYHTQIHRTAFFLLSPILSLGSCTFTISSC